MNANPLDTLMSIVSEQSRKPFGGNRTSQLYMLVDDVLMRRHNVNPRSDRADRAWPAYSDYYEPLRTIYGAEWEGIVSTDLCHLTEVYSLTTQDKEQLLAGEFDGARKNALAAMARIISVELRIVIVTQLLKQEANG